MFFLYRLKKISTNEVWSPRLVNRCLYEYRSLFADGADRIIRFRNFFACFLF